MSVGLAFLLFYQPSNVQMNLGDFFVPKSPTFSAYICPKEQRDASLMEASASMALVVELVVLASLTVSAHPSALAAMGVELVVVVSLTGSARPK